MRTEKNINNPLGLKGEAVEAFEQSYASYSEALIGIDLSQGNDFTAFAPLFPLDDYQSHTGKKGQKNDKVSD